MKENNTEEQLYICRPCGYVMKESELGDVCPACGMPRKVFVEHKERMSPFRTKYLHFDFHPIMVHFPQSVLVLSMFALLLNVFFPHFYPDVLLGATTYAAVIFPFTVIGAFVSGLLDGKIRFRTVMTPILKMKMVYSSVMLLASLMTPFLVLGGLQTMQDKYLLLFCGAIALYCAIVLGHAGKRLMNIGMGGRMKIGKRTL